jgi:hypothetical protein
MCEKGALMDEKLRAALEKLLPYCTSPAGEDYPVAWRWCVCCQIVEGGSEFHKPDCPVVTLRRILLKQHGEGPSHAERSEG